MASSYRIVENEKTYFSFDEETVFTLVVDEDVSINGIGSASSYSVLSTNENYTLNVTLDNYDNWLKAYTETTKLLTYVDNVVSNEDLIGHKNWLELGSNSIDTCEQSNKNKVERIFDQIQNIEKVAEYIHIASANEENEEELNNKFDIYLNAILDDCTNIRNKINSYFDKYSDSNIFHNSTSSEYETITYTDDIVKQANSLLTTLSEIKITLTATIKVPKTESEEAYILYYNSSTSNGTKTYIESFKYSTFLHVTSESFQDLWEEYAKDAFDFVSTFVNYGDAATFTAHIIANPEMSLSSNELTIQGEGDSKSVDITTNCNSVTASSSSDSVSWVITEIENGYTLTVTSNEDIDEDVVLTVTAIKDKMAITQNIYIHCYESPWLKIEEPVVNLKSAEDKVIVKIETNSSLNIECDNEYVAWSLEETEYGYDMTVWVVDGHRDLDAGMRIIAGKGYKDVENDDVEIHFSGDLYLTFNATEITVPGGATSAIPFYTNSRDVKVYCGDNNTDKLNLSYEFGDYTHLAYISINDTQDNYDTAVAIEAYKDGNMMVETIIVHVVANLEYDLYCILAYNEANIASNDEFFVQIYTNATEPLEVACNLDNVTVAIYDGVNGSDYQLYIKAPITYDDLEAYITITSTYIGNATQTLETLFLGHIKAQLQMYADTSSSTLIGDGISSLTKYISTNADEIIVSCSSSNITYTVEKVDGGFNIIFVSANVPVDYDATVTVVGSRNDYYNSIQFEINVKKNPDYITDEDPEEQIENIYSILPYDSLKVRYDSSFIVPIYTNGQITVMCDSGTDKITYELREPDDDVEYPYIYGTVPDTNEGYKVIFSVTAYLANDDTLNEMKSKTSVISSIIDEIDDYINESTKEEDLDESETEDEDNEKVEEVYHALCDYYDRLIEAINAVSAIQVYAVQYNKYDLASACNYFVSLALPKAAEFKNYIDNLYENYYDIFISFLNIETVDVYFDLINYYISQLLILTETVTETLTVTVTSNPVVNQQENPAFPDQGMTEQEYNEWVINNLLGYFKPVINFSVDAILDDGTYDRRTVTLVPPSGLQADWQNSYGINEDIPERSQVNVLLPERTSTIIGKLAGIELQAARITKSVDEGYIESTSIEEHINDDSCDGNNHDSIYNTIEFHSSVSIPVLNVYEYYFGDWNTTEEGSFYDDDDYNDDGSMSRSWTDTYPITARLVKNVNQIESNITVMLPTESGTLATEEQLANLIGHDDDTYITMFGDTKETESGNRENTLKKSPLRMIMNAVRTRLSQGIPDGNETQKTINLETAERYSRLTADGEFIATTQDTIADVVVESDIIAAKFDHDGNIVDKKSIIATNTIILSEPDYGTLVIQGARRSFPDAEQYYNPVNGEATIPVDTYVDAPNESGVLLTSNSVISGGVWK